MLTGLVSARILFSSVGCIAFGSGYFVAAINVTSRAISELVFAMGAMMFLAIRCFKTYDYFARQFATTIYRDFLTYEKTEKSPKE